MIPYELRRRMYGAADLLGEPGATELRKALDALQAALESVTRPAATLGFSPTRTRPTIDRPSTSSRRRSATP